MLVLALWLVAGRAQAAPSSDPGAAYAQLQQGYRLKEAGNCQDAIPHVAEPFLRPH